MLPSFADRLGKNQSLAAIMIVSIALTAINLRTYPYIPETGVAFYGIFLSILIFGGVLCVKKDWSSKSYWLLFWSFSLTILTSRAFVNLTGIGTPKSIGSLGPLTVQQLWINGMHVHHYWAGALILLPASYRIYRDGLSKIGAVSLGVGTALIIDEFGILIAGDTYHSLLSYPAIIITQLSIIAILTKRDQKHTLL